MSLERIRELVKRFRETVASHVPRAPRKGYDTFDRDRASELLESMLLARHLDLAAHELRARGHGHYTITSSGHEINAVLGRLTRPTDPALVHYRSAAFQIERARRMPAIDAVRDIALSLVASSEEPISGGRHKVFGSVPLGIIPITSTIASHLPRALGLAFALERKARLGLENERPKDAIAVVSFGDASLNHSTLLGTLNAASWTAQQNLKLPLLFVCEDNGLGISVRTPEGWVETRLRASPHITYFGCDATDLAASYAAAAAAIEHCRRSRHPAALHLRCVRLLGHAGSDVDTTYRPPAEIESALGRDPVLAAALDLIDAGLVPADEALTIDERAGTRVRAEADRAVGRPKLTSRAEVMQTLAREAPETIALEPPANPASSNEPLTLAAGINLALGEALARYPEALLFGEDVAKKGGVYGVTKGLQAKFGALRVFNTLLDEQTILGIALGSATLGLLPIPEIQYLAYLHNAEDQLRGEAATMAFFSNGAFDNPMVIRIAGLAYQKGFGGHFHNDNSLSVLRDIPEVIVAVPARGDDAVELYRAALALAREFRRVIVIVEPIALYHTRDLHADGDGLWRAKPSAEAARFGRARVYNDDAGDLVVATYGNGVWMSLRAAARLEAETGARVRVLDLRWLSPLPIRDVLGHAKSSGKLLVVDECRRSGNVSEALAAAVLDSGLEIRFARVTSADCFIPLGDAANLVLLDEGEVFDSMRKLTGKSGH